MPNVIVTLRDGTEQEIAAESGLSVMEILRDGGVEEIMALCGGVCSCATCHVHIYPDFSGALPAMSANEDELLDSSGYRDANSRLSCQIPFSDALDGLRIRVAEQD